MKPPSAEEEAASASEELEATGEKRQRKKPAKHTLDLMHRLLEDPDVVAIAGGSKRGVMFPKNASEEVRAKFKI